MADIYRPDYKFGLHLAEDFADHRTKAVVAVIMGSESDWPYMSPCTDMLEQFKIWFEFGVVSAHRTPDRMDKYAQAAERRGLRVIIACAGGSAHLPGMTASHTITIPILSVAPKKEDHQAVGSMIAMPAGVPLAYMGGGSGPGKNAGAVNAALMAARILAWNDDVLRNRLAEYNRKLQQSVPFTCF